LPAVNGLKPSKFLSVNKLASYPVFLRLKKYIFGGSHLSWNNQDMQSTWRNFVLIYL